MKQKKVKVVFHWVNGKPDCIFIPNPLLGDIVKTLMNDIRLYHIRIPVHREPTSGGPKVITHLRYTEYIGEFGGMVINPEEVIFKADL